MQTIYNCEKKHDFTETNKISLIFHHDSGRRWWRAPTRSKWFKRPQVYYRNKGVNYLMGAL